MRASVVALALLLVSLPVQAQTQGCGDYGDMAGSAPLPRVAEAMAKGTPLRVLAIGSASILGPEHDTAPPASVSRAGPAVPPRVESTASVLSFTEQMARALQATSPGLKVELAVQGGRGLTAADQLELLRTALSTGSYQLVIWQTGTVEAVRNLPPSDFAGALADGAAAVDAAGANLVLIDPQFSRFLQTNSNIEPYEEALVQVGALPGVVLFHRFDLMRAWANDGLIDLERTPKPDRQRVVELLHRCLGEQLAHVVLTGAQTHTD